MKKFAADLAAMIATGAIPVRAALPSSQAFARTLNVDVRTVTRTKLLVASHGIAALDSDRRYCAVAGPVEAPEASASIADIFGATIAAVELLEYRHVMPPDFEADLISFHDGLTRRLQHLLPAIG